MLFKIWGFHISSVIWSSCCLTRISVTKHVSEFQCNLSYSVPYGLTSPHTKLSPNTAACLSCRISHLPFTSAGALHCYLLFQSLYHPNVPPGAPVVMFIHTQLLCVSYLLRVMSSNLRCQNCNKLFQMLRGFLNFIYLCHKMLWMCEMNNRYQRILSAVVAQSRQLFRATQIIFTPCQLVLDHLKICRLFCVSESVDMKLRT